ncbi:MAG: hypothetical protein Q9219_006779 [cf. Caloplaca sp. 3 TL-2023]
MRGRTNHDNGHEGQFLAKFEDQQRKPWVAQDRRAKDLIQSSRDDGLGSVIPNQQSIANSAALKLNNIARNNVKTSPSSTDPISWDSPFPVFPLNKSKGKALQEQGLNLSLARMRVDRTPQAGEQQISAPTSAEEQVGQSRACDGGRSNVREGAFVQRSQNDGHNIVPSQQMVDENTNGAFGSSKATQSSPKCAEYPSRAPNPWPRKAYQADNQRSRTMPTTVMDSQNHSDLQATSKAKVFVQGDRQELASNNFKDAERPLPCFPVKLPTHSHSQFFEYLPNSRHVNQEPKTLHLGPPHSQQAGLGEVFDSYHCSPHYSDPYTTQTCTADFVARPEDLMSTSRAIPIDFTNYRRDITSDDYNRIQVTEPALSPVPQKTPPGISTSSLVVSGKVEGLSKSRSSPNLQQQNTERPQQYSDGFNFELPGSIPAMYSPNPQSIDLENPSNANNQPLAQPVRSIRPQVFGGKRDEVLENHQEGSSGFGTGESYDRLLRFQFPGGRNQPLMPGRTPFGQGESRKGSSPGNRTGPRSPLCTPHNKPDALPAHPAPVRAGLVQKGSTNPTRPYPVRQYIDGSASLNEGLSGQEPQKFRAPQEVTLGELDRLRQASRSSPSDSRARLLLAKKLVEAASVLTDKGGHGDSRNGSKSREKFVSEAHKLVRKLVQEGSPEAMFYFGDCYSRGSLGLQTDVKEAFGYYQSAAKAGHAQAAYRVAVCCEMGLDEGGGTKRDSVKAMQWYQRSATLGDTAAMYKLGVIQLRGLLGQPKNDQAALTWLHSAAERADRENPHALHELALLYESPNGVEGIGADEAHAKRLFVQAAHLGYKYSQFRLGYAFEYGLLDCPIDARQSISWYSKAAVQDEHQSELALSGWYLTGSEGVLQQSDTEAYLWARKAAQAGLAKAEYAMGYFTEVGIGAPVNMEDAKRWYWRSASQNFLKARDRLEDLRRGGAKMQKTRVSRSKMNKQSEAECIVM